MKKTASLLVEDTRTPQEAHLFQKYLFRVTSVASNSATTWVLLPYKNSGAPLWTGAIAHSKRQYHLMTTTIFSFFLVVTRALFLSSTLLCRLQSHRSFTRPLVASGCVFQFVTIPETCVYSSINLWSYWSAEKAQCSSLSEIGCAVCKVLSEEMRVWKRRRLSTDALIEAISVRAHYSDNHI